MLQLVHSLHASSLCWTRVLLVRTTCTADDAACTFSARLRPLLDACASDAHYLYRRCCTLCNLRTHRAFTRSVFSLQARTVPPMLQLVQSLDASGLYSARILLGDTNCPAYTTAFAVSGRLGPLLDPGSLEGTNCLTNAAACAVRTRPTILQVRQPCVSQLLQAPSKPFPQTSLVRHAKTRLIIYNNLRL